jgi:hypothetical protein
METKNKTTRNFKAVDFMREVREELTSLYHKDRKKYLAELKQAMKDFKKRQRTAK